MDENTTSAASGAPNDDQAFRELALRLLSWRFGGGAGGEVQLLPRALPPRPDFHAAVSRQCAAVGYAAA